MEHGLDNINQINQSIKLRGSDDQANGQVVYAFKQCCTHESSFFKCIYENCDIENANTETYVDVPFSNATLQLCVEFLMRYHETHHLNVKDTNDFDLLPQWCISFVMNLRDKSINHRDSCVYRLLRVSNYLHLDIILHVLSLFVEKQLRGLTLEQSLTKLQPKIPDNQANYEMNHANNQANNQANYQMTLE